MREILFRGKRKANADWVHGDLSFHRDGRTYIRCWDRLEHSPTYNAYEVDPSTIGQFTGLTDKNGKRIFEGDIIKVEYVGVNRGLSGIGKVVFEQCKFALIWGWHKEVVCLTHFSNVTFEVIGNIHDNPELLEVAK